MLRACKASERERRKDKKRNAASLSLQCGMPRSRVEGGGDEPATPALSISPPARASAFFSCTLLHIVNHKREALRVCWVSGLVFTHDAEWWWWSPESGVRSSCIRISFLIEYSRVLSPAKKLRDENYFFLLLSLNISEWFLPVESKSVKLAKLTDMPLSCFHLYSPISLFDSSFY